MKFSMRGSCVLFLLISSSSVLFAAGDPAAADRFFQKHTVREISLSSSNWNELKNQEPKGGRCNRDYLGDRYEWFNFSSITIDGVKFSNVGVRKRSWCGSFSTSKPSLGISLDRYNTANKALAESVLGTTDLRLNNSVQDRSYIRQCIAYRMFREAGVNSPRCNYAHLVVNGRDLGVYVNIQPYKKDFFRRYEGQSFDGSSFGNVYEIEGADFSRGDLAQFDAHLDSYNEPEDDSLDDVEKIIDVLSDANGSESRINKYIDVAQVSRYWAMEALLAHWDSLNGNRQNAYLYFPPNGKMQVLPWGTDQVLKRSDAAIYRTGRLGKKMWEYSDFRHQVRSRIREFLSSIWNESTIMSSIDTSADAIFRHLPESDNYDFESQVSSLKAQVDQRRSRIQNDI